MFLFHLSYFCPFLIKKKSMKVFYDGVDQLCQKVLDSFFV